MIAEVADLGADAVLVRSGKRLRLNRPPRAEGASPPRHRQPVGCLMVLLISNPLGSVLVVTTVVVSVVG